MLLMALRTKPGKGFEQAIVSIQQRLQIKIWICQAGQ